MTDAGDDLIFFASGSRLVVNLVRVPAPDAWRAKAEQLGLVFLSPPPVPWSPGRHRWEVSLRVLPSAPLPAAERLARADGWSTAWEVQLAATPSGAHIDDDVLDPEERMVLGRSRWQGDIVLAENEGDLLPTALGVALVAAGDGVLYHVGLDRSVFGLDAPAMLARLLRYGDELEEPTA